MPLVINLCTDIAAGLSYIHTRDIIHGGIKAQVKVPVWYPAAVLELMANYLGPERTHLVCSIL
jgi:serine/threonine protein kinase